MYCNRNEKIVVFCIVFSKYLKNADKKIERNHGVLVYKKALMSEHLKNYNL